MKLELCSRGVGVSWKLLRAYNSSIQNVRKKKRFYENFKRFERCRKNRIKIHHTSNLSYLIHTAILWRCRFTTGTSACKAIFYLARDVRQIYTVGQRAKMLYYTRDGRSQIRSFWWSWKYFCISFALSSRSAISQQVLNSRGLELDSYCSVVLHFDGKKWGHRQENRHG